MEGIRRRDSSSLLVLADLTPTQGFENEFCLSESDVNSNSSLTVENSKLRLHQIGNSAKNCVTAWTDEKHDLYLDHLESSFVEQLHWSLLNRTSDSCAVLKSHHRCVGTQRFLRAGKLQDSSNAMNLCTGNEKILFNEAGASAEQTFERRGKSDYFGEFSDQNFTDEASEQKCVTTMSKRSKTIVS